MQLENVIQIVIHFARNLLEIYWHCYQRFAAGFLEMFAKKSLQKNRVTQKKLKKIFIPCFS
jgi:hypothetical protein